MRKEVIGNATLYLGDCFDVMREIATYGIDLILADPPYGIGESNEKNLTRGHKGIKPTNFGNYTWDQKKLDQSYFYEMLRISKNQIIFGGNYYTDFLHNTNCWIVWDKNNTGDFADCELAWTSFNTAVRKFKYTWNGMLQENMMNKENRVHPTQKPIPLMEWIIDKYSTHNQTVLDPFMGSGTTGVACANLHRQFLGIELEPKYFEIACKRIEDAQRQLSLFHDIETKPAKQLNLMAV